MMEALLRYVQSVQQSSLQRAACMAGFVEHLIVVYSQGVCGGGERVCSEGVNEKGGSGCVDEKSGSESGEQADAGISELNPHNISQLTSHNNISHLTHNNTLLDTAFAILHQQTPSHALHLALHYRYHPFLFSLPLQTVLVPSLLPPHP